MVSLSFETWLGEEQSKSVMEAATTQEETMRKNILCASQTSKEIHASMVASACGVDTQPDCGLCACAENGLDPKLSTWPDVEASCVGHSSLGVPSQAYPSPWTYTWTSWGSHLWMGQLITVPSVWSGTGSSFDPCVGSQYPTSMVNSIFPLLGEPQPPNSSVTLVGEPSNPQEEGQTPASSVLRTVEKSPSKTPPSEWASSIWCPLIPSNPELHLMPPSPTQDPEPETPSPNSPWRRIHRRLFER